MSKSSTRLVRLVAALTLIAVLSLAPSTVSAGSFGGHNHRNSNSFRNHFGHKSFSRNFNFHKNFNRFGGHNFHKSFNRNFHNGFHKFFK